MYSDLEKYICDSLDNDYPIALKIGFNFNSLPYEIVYPYMGTKVYDHTEDKKMGWHYIVITGVDYDITTDKCKLTFASWSGKGTFSLKDVKSNSGIFEGAVYIE